MKRPCFDDNIQDKVFDFFYKCAIML